MPRVFKRAAARRDLVQHYVYLAENAGDAVADRFLACAETSFVELSEHPQMGAALTLRRTELGAIRKWRIREFENFLIFYEPRPEGVSIVRVLYAARDWWQLFGIGGP
jgi:toxin ParE1/3/4